MSGIDEIIRIYHNYDKRMAADTTPGEPCKLTGNPIMVRGADYFQASDEQDQWAAAHFPDLVAEIARLKSELAKAVEKIKDAADEIDYVKKGLDTWAEIDVDLVNEEIKLLRDFAARHADESEARK